MEAAETSKRAAPAPEVGGNWFILFGAPIALLVLLSAAWIASGPGPGPEAPPRPPPPPPASR